MLPAMAVLLVLAQAAPPAAHDAAFWQSIAAHDYAPPAGEDVVPLARELSQLLASPDPQLRDEFGYSILTAWITRHKLPPDVIKSLASEWSANLGFHIGSTGTDDVFRRSFSALMLSVVAATDNEQPFLDAAEFRALLQSALTYLEAERDLRGYDAKTGWAHSAAHTADLLKFLARNRRFTIADQRLVLDALAQKMREASVVFTHGEDERMARAVLSIVRRTDFDADGFGTWLKDSLPARTAASVRDPAWLRGRQNLTNLYAKLEVLLSVEDERTTTAPMRSAREALRAVLARLF
jgi:hypothetical protein